MSIIYKETDLNINDVNLLVQQFLDESIFESTIDTKSIKVFVDSPKTKKIVVYKNNIPIGMALGYVTKHPLFNDTVASDLMLYVIKEHRGSIVSVRLLNKLIEWGALNKAKYFLTGQATGIGDLDRTKDFYLRQGFKPTGFSVMKEYNYV